MVLSGGCCCGAVRYETSERVFHATICHCPTCRRVAAAASVAWFTVPKSSYRLTAGAPSLFQSSEGVTRSFCGACGTPLTYARTDAPNEIDVTMCSLDVPDAVAPVDHTFASYRLAWDRASDGLPDYPRLRSEGQKA